MAVITLHYESRFGLARGAVCAGGRPHLYMEGLETDPSCSILGTRALARLKGRGGGVAFLDLPDGMEAILDAHDLTRLADGTAVEIEVAAEARRDKLARARLIRPAPGEAPRRLSPVLTLKDRLLAEARICFGAADIAVAADGDVLDEAADEALSPRPEMAGGGALHVERTRALIACDVDGAGLTEARAKTNDRAVVEAVRRLRLMGLGGLVVIDLIGRRHDDRRLHDALRTAFGAEATAIIVAPAGKFGTLEFVRPWRVRPPADTAPALRQAGQLLRDAARTAAHNPGRAVALRAPAEVLDIVRPLLLNAPDPLTPLLRLETGRACEVIAS